MYSLIAFMYHDTDINLVRYSATYSFTLRSSASVSISPFKYLSHSTGSEYKLCHAINTRFAGHSVVSPTRKTMWKDRLRKYGDLAGGQEALLMCRPSVVDTHDGIQQALLLLRRNHTCIITCAMAYEQTSMSNIEVTCFTRSNSHWRRCSKHFPVTASSPHACTQTQQRFFDFVKIALCFLLC